MKITIKRDEKNESELEADGFVLVAWNAGTDDEPGAVSVFQSDPTKPADLVSAAETLAHAMSQSEHEAVKAIGMLLSRTHEGGMEMLQKMLKEKADKKLEG